MANHSYDVAIAGGGVIGLAIGWRLAQDGANVSVIDRGSAGRGASWASGGMLAAQAETGFDDLDVFEMAVRSMSLWPTFASTVEDASGIPVDYSDAGTLLVADDRDGALHLKRMFDFQLAHGIDVEWISPMQAQQIEPLLTPRITAAVHSRADHQVDPRQLVRALREAFIRAGGTLYEHTSVKKLELNRDDPTWKCDSPPSISGKTVVLATGAWSGEITGLPEGRLPVRPVKGQMLELRMPDTYRLGTVIRSQRAYLAPKRSGRLLIGATSEEMGFDTEVTAGGLYELLEQAWRIVPGIYEMPVTDSWAGLRPAGPDHAPMVGYSEDRRLVYATAHYRNGILLAPVTAEGVRHTIANDRTPDYLAPADPNRHYA